MEFEKIEGSFTVCKLSDISGVDLKKKLFFLGKTDEEISLVCPTDEVPASAVERDDGWRVLRIKGVLDFSLVGILADVSRTLADNGISIFAISTFNTDYVLVKEKDYARALSVLK